MIWSVWGVEWKGISWSAVHLASEVKAAVLSLSLFRFPLYSPVFLSVSLHILFSYYFSIIHPILHSTFFYKTLPHFFLSRIIFFTLSFFFFFKIIFISFFQFLPIILPMSRSVMNEYCICCFFFSFFPFFLSLFFLPFSASVCLVVRWFVWHLYHSFFLYLFFFTITFY